MAALYSDADRLKFVPTPYRGLLLALCLAILAHVLLFLGLTIGLNWKREPKVTIMLVELWSNVPEQVASIPAETPSVMQPEAVSVPDQKADEAELAVESEQQRAEEQFAERDRQLLELRQSEEQQAREQEDMEEYCRNRPEEEANRYMNQPPIPGKRGSRDPCVQG